jgi:hypothetical protein
VTFNSGKILQGGFYLFTIRDTSSGDSSVQDLAENHLDGEFFGSFPSGNGVNGGDFVAELQAVHNKVFAPQTIVGTANGANGGVGGSPVGAVHSGVFVTAVPRGGSPIFSTSTSPVTGDPPATNKQAKHKGEGLAKSKHKGEVVAHSKHKGEAIAKPKHKGEAVAKPKHTVSIHSPKPSHVVKAALVKSINHPKGPVRKK